MVRSLLPGRSDGRARGAPRGSNLLSDPVHDGLFLRMAARHRPTRTCIDGYTIGGLLPARNRRNRHDPACPGEGVHEVSPK